MVNAPFNRCLSHLCVRHKAVALSPPKVITTFHVAWSEKESERNLQLACKRKAMRIVIVVSIVEGKHQWCTSVTHLLPILGLHVEFFQCRLKMEYTIMAAHAGLIAPQMPSRRRSVVQDNR